MSSPTQRSLAHLRKNGWTVCVVEKWNQFAHVRQDAFGFGDLLAMFFATVGDGSLCVRRIALVQATSDNGGNMAKRRAKILSLTTYQEWRNAGGVVLLHAWGKKGARGKRKRWTLREEIL